MAVLTAKRGRTLYKYSVSNKAFSECIVTVVTAQSNNESYIQSIINYLSTLAFILAKTLLFWKVF